MRLVIINPFSNSDRRPRSRRIQFILKVCESEKINFLLINRKGIFENKLFSNDEEESLSPIRMQSNFLRFIKKYLFPDYWIFWTVIQYLKYKIQYYDKDDTIFSISNPFSAHCFGLWLKSEKWIVDIGDSYTSNDHNLVLNTFWRKSAIKFEQRILMNADLIILNSEALKSYYIKQYQIAERKIKIIYNGNFLKFDNILNIGKNEKVLAYFGSTFSSIRTGLKELDILEKLLKLDSDIKLLFIGQFHHEFKAFVNQSATLKKAVHFDITHNDQALESHYAKVSILLNFSNGNYAGLPSKLIEYDQSAMPIINFYSDQAEASLNFFRDEEGIFHCMLDQYNIAELDHFINLNIHKRRIVTPSFSNEVIFKQWKDILTQ
jgi:glycosyltransferase involved in cell wall biosynthesis